MNTSSVETAVSSMSDMLFAVVDCETTGFKPETNRIVQLAAIVINGEGVMVDSFDTIVRPESPSEYTHGAEHIHGISEQQVAHGMPLGDALQKLWAITKGTTFTAHNARFDIGFLHAESERVGIETRVDTHLDTLLLSRLTDVERSRRHSLEALCEHYGIELTHSHEARADATATAELLIHLFKEMNVCEPGQVSALLER
jgi:DNA polymerase III epsilon subunit-like protein